ncbi:FGGY-family carbohydrate kinase [Jiulongibacter sp. NS-SX5]|uniref:FGGY-family carbohydrate kinase n=1 Tax=Jiulongibacter sp. NS-SX5 TaxID=3463854 RepID=UPI0040587FC1
MNTIAIFDIGKTNKKLLLFNEQYEVVYQYSEELPETMDEDGFVCEDLKALQIFLTNSIEKVKEKGDYKIKALNFSGYGASFVFLNDQGNTVGQLYNYLKPFDEELQGELTNNYGPESQLSAETASPFLGCLNSGLQLFAIKHQKPELFKQIKTALHFPQYLAYYFGADPVSELTSIGCHTRLWNFEKNEYHNWVKEENFLGLFPPIHTSNTVFEKNGVLVGCGLHDSSSALIPYLRSFSDPFMLISTGTWSITLNPFNSNPLTEIELAQDCLSFISFEGHQVKASRLFAGQMHEDAVKAIAKHFHCSVDFFKSLQPTADWLDSNQDFEFDNLNGYTNEIKAYEAFMTSLVNKQVNAIRLVLTPQVGQIFIDGGFSKNPYFLLGLRNAFPNIKFYAAELAQASALGAALAIHEEWNETNLPADLIKLKDI